VLLQMEVDPSETAALIRRNRGARLILNLAPALPLPDDALRAVGVLVVNEHEAAWLADRLGATPDATSLAAAVGGAVVRTLGENGVEWAGDGAGAIGSHSVAVVDSTAAGDCFTGVMAAGLDRGLVLGEAIRRANQAAALCCTRAGSQRSLPRAAEIEAALRSA
jgi:ribokinase